MINSHRGNGGEGRLKRGWGGGGGGKGSVMVVGFNSCRKGKEMQGERVPGGGGKKTQFRAALLWCWRGDIHGKDIGERWQRKGGERKRKGGGGE